MSKSRQSKSKDKKQVAFEAVVCEYEAALLRYAYRVVRNEATAQDIVQDTFIRLFTRWKDELTPSPRLSSWLYRVAHNRAIDRMRKETRKRVLHHQHAEERDGFSLPDRGKHFRISEAAEKAADALHALNPREQQLVILKVYEEKSYKEIGAITGLKTGNVGYILHHAMKKLAAELKKADAI